MGLEKLFKVGMYGLLGLTVGCETPAVSGCISHDDCKGARVCYGGECVDPGSINQDPGLDPTPDPIYTGEGEGERIPGEGEGEIPTEGEGEPIEEPIPGEGEGEAFPGEGEGEPIRLRTLGFTCQEDQTTHGLYTWTNGIVEEITPLDMNPQNPRFSPGGNLIVYQNKGLFRDNDTPRGIYVLDTDSGENRLITEGCGLPAWSPEGDRLALYCDERIKISDLQGNLETIFEDKVNHLSWFGDTIAYDPNVWSERTDKISLIDSDGQNWREFQLHGVACSTPNWLPDGRGLLVGCEENVEGTKRFTIETWHLNGRRFVQVEGNDGFMNHPVAPSDGSDILAYSFGTPDSRIRIFDISGDRELENHPEMFCTAPDWKGEGENDVLPEPPEVPQGPYEGTLVAVCDNQLAFLDVNEGIVDRAGGFSAQDLENLIEGSPRNPEWKLGGQMIAYDVDRQRVETLEIHPITGEVEVDPPGLPDIPCVQPAFSYGGWLLAASCINEGLSTLYVVEYRRRWPESRSYAVGSNQQGIQFMFPTWAPNDEVMAFQRIDQGVSRIYAFSAIGPIRIPVEYPNHPDGSCTTPDFFANGDIAAVCAVNGVEGLYKLSLRSPAQLILEGDVRKPRVSSDGTITYYKGTPDRNQIYVYSEEVGEEWLIPNQLDDCDSPDWQ